MQFKQEDFESYGGREQDVNGSVNLSANGTEVRLAGNTWKAVALPYSVKPNTVLEFQFESSAQGEIHGIGLSKTKDLDGDSLFKVYGRQNWGIQDYDNYAGNGSKQTYKIPVGPEVYRIHQLPDICHGS